MHWYIAVLKKYAVFNGRARRKEYWMFVLFNILFAFALGVFEGILGIGSGDKAGPFVSIYQLAIIIPVIAVGIRRMHDVGKNGWFFWIPIYSLILTIKEGDMSENKYGPDPKAAA